MIRSDCSVAIPANVREALDLLGGSGYEAFAVGGCVRDSLLGRAPDDWDICTSA
ncbi:MAG: polynucleotide adenylyltransferase, partial [Clostridia bacterium]|nr:polynucleotide adenylyltransferase [Clostridia bacterium]